MRTIATLAATAFLFASCVRPQVAPQTTGGHQVEESLRDLHKKLDELAATLEATRAQLERYHQPGGGIGEAPPPGADHRSLYNAAYNDYLRGNYDLAQRAFEEYVSKFPGSELTDNAHYWIGETHYRKQRFPQAIDQFEVVLKQYPHSDKAASALLKKGYSHLELGQRSQGVVQLRQVIRQYPRSDEARLALQRLRELGIDPG
jgi:tol-pal system protein YbgF